MSELFDYLKYRPKKVKIISDSSIDGVISVALLLRIFARRNNIVQNEHFIRGDGYREFFLNIMEKPGLVAGYDVIIINLPLGEWFHEKNGGNISSSDKLFEHANAIAWMNHRSFHSDESKTFISNGGNHYSGVRSVQCTASMIYDFIFKYRAPCVPLGFENADYLRDIAQQSEYPRENAVSCLSNDIDYLRSCIGLMKEISQVDLDLSGRLSLLANCLAFNSGWRVEVHKFLKNQNEKCFL